MYLQRIDGRIDGLVHNKYTNEYTMKISEHFETAEKLFYFPIPSDICIHSKKINTSFKDNFQRIYECFFFFECTPSRSK